MITFRSESAYGDNDWDWEFDSVEDIVVEYNKDPRYGSPDLPSDDDYIFDVVSNQALLNDSYKLKLR